MCFSSVRALTVSATLTPPMGAGAGGAGNGLADDTGSRRKAGGGGRFSRLPTGVSGLLVFVIEEVRRIGGGGLFVWMDPRLSRVFLMVPEYTAKY